MFYLQYCRISFTGRIGKSVTYTIKNPAHYMQGPKSFSQWLCDYVKAQALKMKKENTANEVIVVGT